MLIIRQFCIIANQQILRNYSKKSRKLSLNMKQVHQEVMRYVTPYARINVTSDIPVKVRPADVHNNPNGNVFIAELHGDALVKNCPATMQVKVSNDEQEVEVVLTKIDETKTFHCEMELPVRAEVFINGKDIVDISNVDGDNLNVTANKDIITKHIRAENIKLISKEGNISCGGLLLGKNTTIQTQGNGSIILDKLQGDQLHCKTEAGAIRVSSCYVLCSNFETKTGNLDLSNVHKSTSATVLENGDIAMTGVHGNLHLNSNGGNISVQISELQGESIIKGKSLKAATINVSEDIVNGGELEVKTTRGIALSESISQLCESLSEDKKSLRKVPTKSRDDVKLIVDVDCEKPIVFGKLSWADMMRAKMSKC